MYSGMVYCGMQTKSICICTYDGIKVGLLSLPEEATESKGGHFAKLKSFSIAKITILWRGFKFKRGHGPLASLFPESN